MDAWLAIILTRYDRAMFVDAFAGPGEYEKGETGSPLIALNALEQHASKSKMTGQIDFVFVEERADRLAHLEKKIADQRMRGVISSICNVRTFNKEFGEVLPNLVQSIATHRMPAFVMIDPFGVSGAGMENVKSLMKYPSIEVYVSFMYKFINRFKTEPSYGPHLDDLFGCSDWSKGIEMPEGKARKDFFYGLYESQLKAAGAKHVLRFELYEAGQLEYALFFATKNDRGCDRMKQAMWKVAPLGQYSFRGDRLGQSSFESKVVDFSELDKTLVGEFGMNEPVKIETIEQYMSSDKTLFHSGHLKGRLADMERDSKVIVDESPRKKRFGFPSGTVLRFVEPPIPNAIQGSLLPP